MVLITQKKFFNRNSFQKQTVELFCIIKKTYLYNKYIMIIIFLNWNNGKIMFVLVIECFEIFPFFLNIYLSVAYIYLSIIYINICLIIDYFNIHSFIINDCTDWLYKRTNIDNFNINKTIVNKYMEILFL